MESNIVQELGRARTDHGLSPIPASAPGTGCAYIAQRKRDDAFANFVYDGKWIEFPRNEFRSHTWKGLRVFDYHHMRDVGKQLFGDDYPLETYEIVLTTNNRDISARGIVQCWLDSPGHRAVLMNTGEWSEYQWLQVGAGYGRLQQQQPLLPAPRDQTVFATAWFAGRRYDQIPRDPADAYIDAWYASLSYEDLVPRDQVD